MTQLTPFALVALLFASVATAQPQLPPTPPLLQPRGLVTKTDGVAPGYVLYAPIVAGTIFLIDNDGLVVHQWETSHAGSAMYLLPNGNLLRGARDPDALGFRAGGVSGLIQELDWEGNVVWEMKLSDEKRVLHHDIEPLPNGNVLALGWEVKTAEEVKAAGRKPGTYPEKGLHPEFIVEIEPTPPSGGKIVWSWHIWDHLIQDHDPSAPNHGNPSEHPGRLDINAGAAASSVTPEELEQLKALGYVPEDATPEDIESDFLHANAIDHHAGLDQIAISVPELGEVWIIDHGTTTEEAKGPAGDLLYRWGNPGLYGRGEGSPQRLFYQHDVRWIPEGWERAGNLTILNNGRERPEGPWTSVDEIDPPVDENGRYRLETGKPYGPAELAWTARLSEAKSSPFISGSERVRGGNTIVCSGTGGLLVELSPTGEIVWEFRNPWGGVVPLADGSPPQPGVDGLPLAVYRASRIPPTHPGLSGRTLAPLDPQPPWHEKAERASPTP